VSRISLGYEPLDAWDALDRECAGAIIRHRAHGHSTTWLNAWLQRVIRHAETLPEGGVWRLAGAVGGWESCSSCGEWEHQCRCGEEPEAEDLGYLAWHRAIYCCDPELEEVA
jgi:hypothetical protein